MVPGMPVLEDKVMAEVARIRHTAMRYERSSASGQTHVFRIESVHNGCLLGTAYWYPPWRKYIFSPAVNTIWDSACLAELQQQLDQLNADHKKGEVRKC
jgi:hypothetical protein